MRPATIAGSLLMPVRYIFRYCNDGKALAISVSVEILYNNAKPAGDAR
jgi:hypothetical protein